jgi:hypothetical protein
MWITSSLPLFRTTHSNSAITSFFFGHVWCRFVSLPPFGILSSMGTTSVYGGIRDKYCAPAITGALRAGAFPMPLLYS